MECGRANAWADVVCGMRVRWDGGDCRWKLSLGNRLRSGRKTVCGKCCWQGGVSASGVGRILIGVTLRRKGGRSGTTVDPNFTREIMLGWARKTAVGKTVWKMGWGGAEEIDVGNTVEDMGCDMTVKIVVSSVAETIA